jgi:hypothetical protein
MPLEMDLTPLPEHALEVPLDGVPQASMVVRHEHCDAP